jgi:hypothetical protein
LNELPLLEDEQGPKSARQDLERWLSQEIGQRSSEHRQQLLSLRRDCHRGKSLDQYRELPASQGWTIAGQRFLDAVLFAEKQQNSASARLEAAYEKARQEEGKRLLAIAEGRGLFRGLVLGSTSLVAGMQQRHRHSPRQSRRERRLEESLARYLSRAAIKLSPFSTLTRAALAEAHDGKGPLVLLGQGQDWHERSLVRVPRMHLEACLDLLRTYPPVRERLAITINEAREETAPGRYLLLRPGCWKPDLVECSSRYAPPAIVEVDLKSPIIPSLVTHLSGRELTYRDLLKMFSREVGGNCQGTVDELLRLGFLLSRYPWNTDDPHLEARFLEHLKSMAEAPEMGDLARILAETVSLEREFPQAPFPETCLAKCHDLMLSLWNHAARLAGIDIPREPPADQRGSLYEDVFLVQGATPTGEEAVAQMGRERADELLRTLEPLMQLAGVYDRFYDFLVSLASLCSERFPSEVELPWLKVLRMAYPLWRDFALFENEADRAGLPRSATFNPLNLPALNQWREVRERLLRDLPACVVVESEMSSSLSSALLSELLASIPVRPELPRAPCFFLQPIGSPCEQWVLNRVVEAGRFHSRYAAAMSEEMREAVTGRYRCCSTLEHGGETWELLDILYPAGEAINVHGCQTPRILEMPGERSSETAARRLSLGNLRVVIPPAGRLPFLTDREGRRVLPMHMGPILLHRMPVPLKFLCVFGLGRVDLVLPEPQSRMCFPDADLYPRLTLGPVTLRRRRWVTASGGLRKRTEGLSPARFFAALETWRKERGIPAQVFLPRPARIRTTRAKPLFIDFRSPIFVELFRQRLVESEQLTMEEVLPAIDQGIQDEAGARWAVELQIDSLLLPT